LKLNKEVPISQIKEFLECQQVHQLHTEKRSKPAFRPITVYSVNDQWQIDLINFSKYSKWNAGFKYLLCGIDVFSRKSFVVAMKKKSDTINAMKLILDVQKPILIQSDNGTEFLNHSFQNLLQAKGVRHITANVGDHNRQSLVERFNRTLENIIKLYQESRKSNRYINVLEDIVFNYNHTYHRGVNDVPEVRYQENPSSGSLKVKTTKHSIKVGDRVRILKEKHTFRKGYESNSSNSIYTVVSGNGYSYSIADDEGEILQKTYKYYELQRITYIETFVNEPRQREPTMTNKERRNKREIDDLLEHTVEPLRKKRRIFTGTYFLE
jgi:transposase InsO family protein